MGESTRTTPRQSTRNVQAKAKTAESGAGCRRGPARRRKPMLALTQLSNYLALKGSFSAVSKPNFASKYALESSHRDLQNALLSTVLVGSAVL